MGRQVEKKQTKQVRIDQNFHKVLRIEAAKKYTTIKSVLEERAGWVANRKNQLNNINEEEK